MRTLVFVVTLAFLTAFGTASAKILFVDDFEQDDIGGAQSKIDSNKLI